MTIKAVRAFELNVVSLHELLEAVDHRSLGRQLCDAVKLAVHQVEQALARHDAGGHLDDANRNLTDAVARLARACDNLAQVPCDDLYAHFCEPGPEVTDRGAGRWFDSDGQLRPYAAVLILAQRIGPHAQRAQQDPRWRAGNWREHTTNRQALRAEQDSVVTANEPAVAGGKSFASILDSLPGPVGDLVRRSVEPGSTPHWDLGRAETVAARDTATVESGPAASASGSAEPERLPPDMHEAADRGWETASITPTAAVASPRPSRASSDRRQQHHPTRPPRRHRTPSWLGKRRAGLPPTWPCRPPESACLATAGAPRQWRTPTQGGTR